MTQLSPDQTPTLPPQPPRLSWLTFPLMVELVFQAISLLTLPFSGRTLNDTLSEYDKLTGMKLPPLTDPQIQAVLWISFVITAVLILWIYNTRRAVLEGKRWGRISSIVLAILSLLVFPFGTLLGIVMLIGVFDRDVRGYLRR